MLKVYLAGCKGDWRRDVQVALCADVEFYDPFEHSRQGAIYAFTSDDLAAIRDCDLVLAGHFYPLFDGLALECGYAHALDKPIVYVSNQPRLSSMICGVAAAVFTDLPGAWQFIRSHYVDDGPSSAKLPRPTTWTNAPPRPTVPTRPAERLDRRPPPPPDDKDPGVGVRTY